MKTFLLLLATSALSAQVGIGTANPESGVMCDVNGVTKTLGFKMPTGAKDKGVLTSDASGVASWQVPAIDNVVGTLGATGVNITAGTTSYIQTGSSITLAQGKWAVNVSMLMRLVNVAAMPNSSSYFLRTTLSNSNLSNPVPSPDIISGKLASGNLTGSSIYGLVIGTIIIHNQTTANKTYYYVAGNVVFTGQPQTLENFGGANADENRIIAYKIN